MSPATAVALREPVIGLQGGGIGVVLEVVRQLREKGGDLAVTLGARLGHAPVEICAGGGSRDSFRETFFVRQDGGLDGRVDVALAEQDPGIAIGADVANAGL